MERELQDSISLEVLKLCEDVCLIVGAKYNKIITLPEFRVKIEENGKELLKQLDEDRK